MAPPRILVADDDPVIRIILEHWLTSAGYTPAVFGDGAEALASVRADPPDLVILDHVMAPVDGLAIYAALQAEPRLQSIPVLFLTGAPQDIPALCGEVSVLGKPFRLEALEDTVRSLLERRAAR